MPTRTCRATPPIFGGADGANAGAIHVDICEACFSAEQTIQMRFHMSRGLHDDVIILIRDYILDDQRSGDRRRAEDVNAGGAGRERVIGVCAIARNAIRDELVVIEIVERVVTVEGDARQTDAWDARGVLDSDALGFTVCRSSASFCEFPSPSDDDGFSFSRTWASVLAPELGGRC